MALGLVDTALVGHVDADALAAVALGNTLVFAMSMPAYGIFLALEPVTAQALGANEPKTAASARRAGMFLSLAVAPAVMLLAWASTWLLPVLHVDPAVIPGARAYVAARIPSLLPFFVFMTVKTFQQAAGRPRLGVEAVIGANVVHAIVGALAVFGDRALTAVHLPAVGLPAFGVVGAGLTTSASSALMAGWVMGPRGARAIDPRILESPRDRAAERAMAKKLLRLGLPIGLQLSAEVGIFSLVALLMGRLGPVATAAHQIALSLASMSFMGALGVAQSTSVRVGQFVGGADREGARRAGLVGIAMGVSIMSIWAVIFALAPRALAAVFSDDPAVLAAATTLVRIAAIFQLGDGAQVVSAGALRGAGDTRWPLALNVIVHWCIGLPIAWWLGFGRGLGAPGLWYGLTIGLLLIGASLLGRFLVLSRREIARV
jgi:MATE family multidrug resistance protein